MINAELLQSLVANLVDGVVVIDEQGVILNVNPGILTLFGYSQEELKGKNVNILMPEPYHSNHDRYLEQYARTGKRHILNASRELVAKRKNGSMFPIFLHVNEAYVDKQRRFIGVIHDISGRKLAETAYKETDNKLQAILDTAVEGMIIIDDRGRMEMANPAALKLFDYTEAEVLGKNVNMLMPEPDRSGHDGYIRNFRQSREPKIIGIGREVRGRKKDGSEFPFRLSVSEVKLRNTVIYVGILHDLTQEKDSQVQLEHYADQLKKANADLEAKVAVRTSELERMNENLKRINLQLQEEVDKRIQAEQNALKALEKEKDLNEMKGRFVSMASHEFRTPLSGILTSVSLLGRYTGEGYEERRNHHIATIRSSVHNLTSILNDFLSLDKLDEGGIELKTAWFPLHPLLVEFSSEIENTCKPGQSIRTSVLGDLDQVIADRHLIKNILINLTSNAIKYSGENQPIDIKFERVDGNLQITVADQGIGIPIDDQEHMFERLFRASNVTNIQGTGLGLNIVKKYIDLHLGTIAFVSRPGEGTTFTVTIPQD